MSASPSLVSIEKTMGATSRVIAWSIAFWLVLLSCCGNSRASLNMPRPVMAAALFFNGALMLVAGMQIIASRPITLRPFQNSRPMPISIGISVMPKVFVPEKLQ